MISKSILSRYGWRGTKIGVINRSTMFGLNVLLTIKSVLSNTATSKSNIYLILTEYGFKTMRKLPHAYAL